MSQSASISDSGRSGLGGNVPASAGFPSGISAPQQRWRLLRRLIPKCLQPAVRGLRKRAQLVAQGWRTGPLEEPYATVFPYTQTHMVRQRNITRLAHLIDEIGVPGALVECGVLDGGTAALMAHATCNSLPARPVHLFDSWDGLPEATAEDGDGASQWSGEDVGSPQRVLAVMRKLGVRRDRLVLHRGWFDQTFPSAVVGPIALLHIDADFYNSVKLCLEQWYSQLSPGGFVQIDDYDSFSGCHKAVKEFLAKHDELRLERFGEGAEAWYFQRPLVQRQKSVAEQAA
jgi:O-methyltransferase